MKNVAMFLIFSFTQSLRIILTTFLSTMNAGLLISLWILCSVYNLRAVDACLFPSGLAGTWYQIESQEHIIITRNNISNKGQCRQNETDKFLLEDKTGCFRCLVLLPKHPNFLQYKESPCGPSDTLEKVCDRITGDSRLFSMFRVNGEPIKCPFKGPFKFTYDTEEGECKTPESTMDMCTDPSIVSLKFQACTDLDPSERKDVKMHCLGIWKETTTYNFLVAELHHDMMRRDEEKYRCILYEETPNGDYFMSQSADASCQAMNSPREGALTMKLKKTHFRTAHCRFPAWLTKNHQWHTLNNKWKYTVSRNNATLRIVDSTLEKLDMEATCQKEIEQPENRFTIIAFALDNCHNGFICMNFVRRSRQVVQFQKGTMTSNIDEACSPDHFDNNTDFTTLIVSSLEADECPYSGRNSVLTPDNSCDKTSKINFGCNSLEKIKIVDNCGMDSKHEVIYHCHGYWDDRGVKYLIASEKKTKTKSCFIYKEENDVIRVSSISGSCKLDSDSSSSSVMKYVVTPEGQCAMTGNSTPSMKYQLITFIIVLLVILILH